MRAWAGKTTYVAALGSLAAVTPLLLGAQVDPARLSTSFGPARVVTVSTAAEAAQRIKNSTGELTIRLEPGNYGELIIRDREAGGQLTIESADRHAPAVITRLRLNGADRTLIQDVIIKASGPLGPAEHLVTIRKSNNVALERVRIEGADRNQGGGLLLRAGEYLRVEGSTISGFRYGISMQDLRDVRIEGNELYGLRTDAIRGGGVSDLLVASNVIGDFFPAPADHPDGIQLWSKGEERAARNIVIRDNLLVRGKGDPFQGIFIRDNLTQLPFENVRVSGNLVIGSMSHGISFNGLANGDIAENEVVAFPDAEAWIYVDRATDVRLTSNRAMKIVIRRSAEVSEQGNELTMSRAAASATLTIRHWFNAKPDVQQVQGPYLSSLLGN